MTMIRLLLVLVLLLWAVPGYATTYYLSDTGSDIANGTSTSTPWRTYNKAFGGTGAVCGDTVTLLNGTHAQATAGQLLISGFRCTASTPITVNSQTSRQATVFGSGTSDVVKIVGSSYIIIDGIYARSQDVNSGGNQTVLRAGVTGQSTNDHITVKNSVFSHANRYFNSPLVMFENTTDSLLEDNEMYYYHRIGFSNSTNTTRNVGRRNYSNSRGYADIAGGTVTGWPTVGDEAFANYPGIANIFENNISEGTFIGYTNEALGTLMDNKYLGNISLNDFYGQLLRSRGPLATDQPINDILENLVIINPSTVGVYLRGERNATVRNITIYDPTNNAAFIADNPNGNTTVSFTGTNMLSVLGTIGFNVNSATSWSLDRVNAYLNSTNYVPSSSPNLTNNGTTDPQLGTCRVFIPTASPMHNAGVGGTTDIGANILYRYQDGVLTSTPLWDPTTGEFPHGATVTGLNDVAGSSAFDVHQRLSVNYNGCNLPAGYGGGGTPPANPSTYASSTGTSSTSHAHTFAAGSDIGLVGVSMRATTGGVGSVSAVTGCGGEAYAQIANSGVSSSPDYYRTEWWYKLTPTTGACTIAVTTTGTVNAMVTISAALDDVASIGAVATANGLSSSPSVTVTANPAEYVIDLVTAASYFSQGTVSGGANQTVNVLQDHPSIDLRGYTSEQSGNDGGVMSWTFGGGSYWAQSAIALVPQGGSTPPSPTPTLTQRKGQWRSFYGTEAAATALPYTGAPVNTNAVAHTTGKLRVRVSVIAQDNDYPATGFRLYCSPNGGAYAEAVDTFGSNKFRLIGAGYDPLIPSSLTPTTQIIDTGTFVPGVVLRSDSVATTLTLLQNEVTELEWPLELNASAGDTIDCRAYLDNGSALDTYTVTPRVTVQALSAGVGF